MTTTEKRGFRLPWGSENRKADNDPGPASEGPAPEPAEPVTAASDLTPAIAAASTGSTGRSGSGLRRPQGEDLGRGPFDLQPAPEPETPAAVPADAPVTEPADGLVAWPDIDRAGSATHLASDAPPPPARPAIGVDGDAPAAPRRTNPLMAGLVKAMRDAARSARDEATTKMRSDAAARLAEIRTQAATTGATFKKQADDDVAQIREWSKTEAARIREETDERIAARRAELVRQIEDHAGQTLGLQAAVNGAITAFDVEMERFFDILLKEDDPARLATLAERLPEAPGFARPMGAAGASTPRPRAARPAGRAGAATPRQRTATSERRKSSERLAPAAAAAAEAEAIAGLDDTRAAVVSEPEPPTAVAPEPTVAAEPQPEAAPDAPAGSLANVLATAPRIDSPDDLSPEERIALLGFDEPEASADGTDDGSPAPVLGVPLEPDRDTHAHSVAQAAVTPLEDVTRIVVTGLSSVAGISAFKSALGGVTGVVSVSVSSGMDHDFVFSVVHADATDLRRAIAAFPAFAAQMTLDEGAVVSFIVTEPAT